MTNLINLIQVIFFLIPITCNISITKFDVHWTVEVFFPEILKFEAFDVCCEELNLFMLFGLVVCIKDDSIYFQRVNYRFWQKQFCDFKVMDEKFIALIVKSEVEVSKFVQWQILEPATAWNYYVAHFRSCDEWAVVLVVSNTP